MSIFGNILGAIFGSKSASAESSASSTAPASPPSKVQAQAGSALQASSTQAVDVEAVMNDLAAKNKEKLNWRTSIVDLMKLLKLDRSLASARIITDSMGAWKRKTGLAECPIAEGSGTVDRHRSRRWHG